jgi:mono/diheme cytochrome c family protein
MRVERLRAMRTPLRLLATLVLTVTASSCTPLDNLMAVIFGRSMRDQPSFDPYENTRLPAVGSIPFASGNLQPGPFATSLGEPLPLEYDLPQFDQTGLLTVAAALENPVPADAASLERGKEMYDRYCAVCHGPNGLSAESPIISKHGLMMAFNLAMGPATTYSDGYIYGMIRVGRSLMPPYGHQIPNYDRWHIVNYVRQLQGQGAGVPAGGAPAAPAPTGPGEN